MRIIVAGAGDVGTHLAKILTRENHDIILLDEDSKRLQAISRKYDLMPFKGVSTSIKDLIECGVKEADLFVGVTPYESINTTACLLAAKLGAKKTLARINNYEYLLPDNKTFFDSLGIQSLIYPEMLAAKEIAKSLKSSWQRVNISFENDALTIVGVKVRENAPIINQQFQSGFLDHGRFRIVAIKRDTSTIIPSGTDQILPEDIVYFITTNENLDFLREQAGKTNNPIKDVIVMGGSRIGVKTIQYLPEKIDAKIIEFDKERCLKISEEAKGNLIICGDGRDLDLLRQEGVSDTDAFVAVTGNSEANILACLAAKRLGVFKTVAEIENFDYIPLAESLDIGTIINKKVIAANHIHQLTLNPSVLNIKSLHSSKAQIIEFEVKEKSKIAKGRIRDHKIPSGVNFGGYIRDGIGYICSGNTTFNIGDKVIVFCFASDLHKIESFFN